MGARRRSVCSGRAGDMEVERLCDDIARCEAKTYLRRAKFLASLLTLSSPVAADQRHRQIERTKRTFLVTLSGLQQQ